MRALVVSNMYPHPNNPAYGSFVRDQVDALVAQGVECVVVGSAEYRKGIWYTVPKYLSLLFRTLKAALSQRFDVIHAHYVFLTPVVAYIANLISKSPLVITDHGPLQPHIATRWSRYLVEFAVKRADHIIAVGESTRDELRDEFNVPESRFSVINMGVDTELFRSIPKSEARDKLGLPHFPVLFVCVSRLVWVKGIHYLLQSISEFSSVYDGVRFVIVGNGPQAIEFKQISADLGLEDKVWFVGAVEKQDVPLWLSSADGLIHPSIGESFGLAVVEAMSCSRLVVASAVGGIPTYVVDGKNGFLVEPGNTRALAEKIEYVLSLSSAETERIQNAARATATEHDIHVQAKRVKQVYHQVIAGNY